MRSSSRYFVEDILRVGNSPGLGMNVSALGRRNARGEVPAEFKRQKTYCDRSHSWPEPSLSKVSPMLCSSAFTCPSTLSESRTTST